MDLDQFPFWLDAARDDERCENEDDNWGQWVWIDSFAWKP